MKGFPRSVGCLLAAGVLLATVPARADRIVTVGGGVLRGKIVRESARAVELRDSRGLVVRVPRDEIEEVVREDGAAEFARRRAALAPHDVEGRVALARWAKGQGLHDEARRLLEEVLELAPDHPFARRALGYRRVQGRWLRGAALARARKQARAKRAAEAAAGGGAGPEPRGEIASESLPAGAEELLAVVRGSGPSERRQAAARALAERGPAARKALGEALGEDLAAARKHLLRSIRQRRAKIRARLAAAIRRRRAEALAVIFDEQKYPSANHGAAGQPLVDRLVGALLRAYDDPLAELAEDAEVARPLARFAEACRWLREFCGDGRSEEGLLAEVHAEVAKIVGMRGVPVDRADARVLRESQAILRRNERLASSLGPEERACIRATNEYRMVFGLRALKVHEPLVRAARGHSQDMLERGFFDHTSPVPGKRTPADRCRLEGASFSGENIAMGMQSGRGAFNAWYTSSGHHRNMLGKAHRSLGVGRAGNYWTQDFSGEDPP
ncbi:MAG: CAP domain-containing protein [Planctomycetota bacterium]|nr:MAG: CAP domain-containing protein [Planctomycetota bacterium]